MKTFLKLFLLVLLLNIIRYLVGGFIEGFTIMEPMHRVMPVFPEVFDNNFTSTDFYISLGYNFMMWFTATWVFHLLHPVLNGHFMIKSFKVFGLMCLFFCAVAAIYMNHFTSTVKPFFAWSMLDALIVFSIVALANGFLYPLFFKPGKLSLPDETEA